MELVLELQSREASGQGEPVLSLLTQAAWLLTLWPLPWVWHVFPGSRSPVLLNSLPAGFQRQDEAQLPFCLFSA